MVERAAFPALGIDRERCARGTFVDLLILVGHTVPRKMKFPGAVEHSPSDYRY